MHCTLCVIYITMTASISVKIWWRVKINMQICRPKVRYFLNTPRILSQVNCIRQVVKTLTIIFNNPVHNFLCFITTIVTLHACDKQLCIFLSIKVEAYFQAVNKWRSSQLHMSFLKCVLMSLRGSTILKYIPLSYDRQHRIYRIYNFHRWWAI